MLPEVLDETDLPSWAWRQLLSLASTEYASSLIAAAFPKDAKKHRNNIRKQALQLGYCLVQAREYFAAARAVNLPTKPNLLYYGLNSLAAALVLRKGDGEYALDFRRRQGKGHHGMDLASVPAAADFFSEKGWETLRRLRKITDPVGLAIGRNVVPRDTSGGWTRAS